uniref:hypothetical protein n=1 Tax=Algoriphagus sp. TaxID=1872435 RepID=UPI004047E9B3
MGKKKNNYLFISFILILFLPEGLSINLHIQSSSLGGLLSWIIVILILIQKDSKYAKFNYNFLKLLTLVLFIIIISFFTGLIINNNFDFNRYLSSILLFIFQLTAAYLLVKRLSEEPSDVIDKLLKKISITLLLLSYISMIKWYIFSSPTKEMIVFTEPSHYAIAASPFFMYFIICSNKKHSFVFTLLILFSAILMENLTLVIPILIALFILNKKVLIIFSSIFVVLLPIFDPTYYLYITARTTSMLDSDNQNLSSLVYLQGWEYVGSSIKYFKGIGIGFQQLGQIRIKSTSQEILEYMGYPFNQNDGAFFFSKFFVEFGWIAILIILFYLIDATNIYLKINKLILSKKKFKIFLSVCFLSFFIPLFVRNSSYFNPAIFIFYMSLLGFGLSGGIKKTLNVRN